MIENFSRNDLKLIGHYVSTFGQRSFRGKKVFQKKIQNKNNNTPKITESFREKKTINCTVLACNWTDLDEDSSVTQCTKKRITIHLHNIL